MDLEIYVAKNSGLNRTGVLARVTVAALTAALVGTSTVAMAAEPGPALASKDSGNASAFAASALSAYNNLYGVNSAGTIWGYTPVNGGIQRLANNSGTGWTSYKHFTQPDLNGDRRSDGIYAIRSDGRLNYGDWGGPIRDLGGGWNTYNKVFSAGNTGGGVSDDLLARDGSGVLWHYLGYGNGALTQRVRIGSGWNQYSQIAGKGDVTGDGKADIVASDRSGVLWLYKGTGSRTAPFSGRVRVGTGWNTYNLLASSGDLTGDGRADLVGRNAAGELYLYKGRGSSTDPYAGRVKIGTSGWNGFRYLF
ncbi:FG-GAP repeat domain-containing protein [Streptomyces omiyaensis]|uniref:FG-GAP repeat domain-containing protein n=1 Tax=Streptomyces omiyaensis TaxID=68247 RepID=A0ABW7BW64_9ACTN